MGSAKLKELNRISIGTVGLTVVTAVLLFVPLPLFCRIVVVVMFLGWLGFRLGRFLVGSREGVITRLVFGLMIVLSWLVVSQSIVYYLDRISRFSLLVGLLPLVFFAIHRFNLTETTNQTIIKPKSSIWSRWLSIGILVGDVVLFFSFLSVRTDEALRSPWEVVSCSALLAFVSVTWMLLLLCREPDAPFKRSLTALHLFVAYCLSPTVISSSPLRSLVIGLSVSAMMIHPLLGAVAVGLIASLFLCHPFRFGGLLSVIINAILLPILFFIHNWLKGDLPFNFL